MSQSSEEAELRWIDRWWPLFVILYGVIFVGVVTHFSPTI
jgi:hypothetical protein